MCLKAVAFDTCSQSLPPSLHPSIPPNDPQHSLPSSLKPKICFNIVGRQQRFGLQAWFNFHRRRCEQKYATSMRPVGLSGEYATPMIKFLAWQEESGLWPKIVVVSPCWQHVGRQAGGKVIEFLSDYKLRIRHAWLQLMTGSCTAHSTP